MLAETVRPYQGKPTNLEGPRVKFLITNAVIEGTVNLADNPQLLNPSPYANGVHDGGEDFDAIYLTDVAIRPLNEPEVHVGLNKLQLFVDSITAVIG
jgi:hypothetical protein